MKKRFTENRSLGFYGRLKPGYRLRSCAVGTVSRRPAIPLAQQVRRHEHLEREAAQGTGARKHPAK